MDLVFKLKSDDQLLRSLLLYHVLPGQVRIENVPDTLGVRTIEGSEIAFRKNRSGILINNEARILKTSINATNGFIHAIDKVLVPNSLRVRIQLI